jgi:leucyl-tRNA synthetase
MRRYNPKEIEPKWQKIWDETQVYKADLHSDKPKYIAMSMFNYPSGNGIHIGHAMNYTISDVMARFKRQQGYESYHPVGWDAFGLPAENYAIKTGVSPQQSMASIIPSYHKQYKAMAWSNDWSKEISTHLPAYYKWTQWIFAEMFRAGMAYQDARMQWWCTKCQTVLANEQVIDGKCWRHDAADDPEVKKREVKQWFFKVTDYADEMLAATYDLDWSEVVKTAQINWIGKSQGAEVKFAVADHDGVEVTVFTTRPDTLYGATFMVLAPEHELVGQITLDSQKAEIDAYVAIATKKTDVERQENKEKTGVFTGAYAVNPVNGTKVPIWIADYVLTGYGTGAIMAVPAHDERDHEFAEKFDLPVIRVVKNDAPDDECSHEEGVMMNSAEYDGMPSADAREKIVADLAAKGIAEAKTNFRIRDWSVSRQRYWGAPIPIINCPKHGAVLDPNLPVLLPELEDFQPSGDGRSALARATDWLHVPCPECGEMGERETDTLDTYICSSWYFLRYLDPANTEEIFSSDTANKWMPIDFYNGGDHATAHMIYARFVTRFFWHRGLLNEPEPFKKFLFNGKVTASDGTMFSKSKGNGVDPLEIIAQGYGADALRTYLMFAAPLDLWMRWDPQGVPGTFRFLQRIWNLTQEFLESKDVVEANDEKVLKIIHPVIKKVTADLEEQKYNTAIAAMMKCVNDLYALKASDGFANRLVWQFTLESLVALVAPFAPHTADELWHDLGKNVVVQRDSWPVFDEKYCVADMVTLAVQVNGKLRGTVNVPADSDEAASVAAAKADEKVASYLAEGTLIKTIYVPMKLVSFVIR